MPAMHGFSLLKRIREEGIETPVVILTMCDSHEDLANAMRAGVRGYLLKDMDPDDVVDSIRRAVKGELVVAPAMATKLIAPARRASPGARTAARRSPSASSRSSATSRRA